MRLMKNQPWWDDPAYVDLEGEVEWNLFQKREPPFKTLTPGDEVYLACGDGHGGSVIWGKADVNAVVAARYESKVQAWKMLHSVRPELTRSDFMSDPYTVDKPGEGWLLGWQYGPVIEIGVPRPPELKFRPSGWRSLDEFPDSQLRSWGLLP